MPVSSGSIIDPLKSIFDESTKSVDKVLQNENDDNSSSFQNKLVNALNEIKGMEDSSEQYSYEIAMGNTENLEAMMINSAKLNTTVSLATTITSRVVNTYKEILQMQV
jgi:flagellar hook-basal body complex protein FliE